MRDNHVIDTCNLKKKIVLYFSFFFYIFLLDLEDVFHVLLKYKDKFYMNFKGERRITILYIKIYQVKIYLT